MTEVAKLGQDRLHPPRDVAMVRRPMESPATPPISIFRHHAFACFWSARFLSTLGVQAQSITIGWQVYAIARKTHSVAEGAFLVGMVGLAQFVPLFCLTFIAGATADRHDRRTIMLSCVVAGIALVSALAVLALQPHPVLWPIFAIAAGFGASRAFLSPASGAMGPMLVPREILPTAIAWNSLGGQFGSILGPWIGGALCAASPAVAYAGSGVLYVGAGIALLLIRVNTRPTAQTASRLELIREGIVYVWTNKIVLGAITLDLFAVLLGGATALLPVFARDILKIGPHGFGVLRSGPAIGAAVMAFTLSRFPIRRHAGVWMFCGVAVYGLSTLVFALSKWEILTLVALAVLGAADMISVYVRQSLVQIVTPDHMRGRVSAVSFLFIGASNELGEFETGMVTRLMGPINAAVFGGLGSLIVTGAWSRMFPSLRKADLLTRPEG